MPERVSNDEVEADGSVKDQVASMFGLVTEGNEADEVIKEHHGKVEADSLPVESLAFIVNVYSMQSGKDEEGSSKSTLEYLVNSVSHNSIQTPPETVGRQSAGFLRLQRQDVGLEAEPFSLDACEVLLPRKLLSLALVVDQHDAVQEVEDDYPRTQVEHHQENLDVFVGVVLRGMVLPARIHQRHHLVEPPFHDRHQTA